jgi:hypothetical protein
MIGTTTATATNNKIATNETTKTIKTTNSATTAIQHALSSKGKNATNNKKLPMTAANTATTNHSESDNEIFALEEKRSVTNNDQDIITKQDYILEIAIGVLADVITK